MPTAVPVTYAGAVYDRTRALFDGEVRVPGVDLRYLDLGIEEVFWRHGRTAEFDAAEYSFGAFLASLERSDRALVAIPVFPSKAFRHSALYVRADSPVTSPAELSGRTIGTPEWSMTASLWMRGILGEHYGLDLPAVRWRTGGLEQPGRTEKSSVRPPERFDVTPLPEGATLTGQLLAGDLDAVLTARPPRAFLAGDPRIRRVFVDYTEEEQRFFARTGVLPIMHVVTLSCASVERHPWLPNNLRHAFEEARARAVPALRDSAVCTSSLVWEAAYAEREAETLGDAFAYGVEPNRVALTTLLRYAEEQGFLSRPHEPEELFHPSTITDAKI
jgi:4,5-dihydroxyphthalate decarboxylase